MNTKQAIKVILKKTPFKKIIPHLDTAHAALVIGKGVVLSTAFAYGYISQRRKDRKVYNSMYTL